MVETRKFVQVENAGKSMLLNISWVKRVLRDYDGGDAVEDYNGMVFRCVDAKDPPPWGSIFENCIVEV